MEHHEVLNLLSKYQQKWEQVTIKLIYNKNETFNVNDIIHDMYIQVYEELEKKTLLHNEIIVNDKPHFGIVKNILYRIIVNKINKKINHISIHDLFKELSNEETKENNIDEKIDEALATIHWFDRKLFNLYRKEFHTIRSLSKATKISHAIVHKSIAKCKREIQLKLKDQKD